MDFQLISGLGVEGMLFLAAFVAFLMAITEFVKTVLYQRGTVLRGLAVIILSLVMAALLGGLLLQGVAGRMNLELATPWRGMALGLVLGMAAAGWYARTMRIAESKGQGQALALQEALNALERQQDPSYGPYRPQQPGTPTTIPDEVTPPQQYGETLRPMNEEDVSRTRLDWPITPGLDDPPLVHDGDGPYGRQP